MEDLCAIDGKVNFNNSNDFNEENPWKLEKVQKIEEKNKKKTKNVSECDKLKKTLWQIVEIGF